MKIEQLLRLDKIKYEKFFLLNKTLENNKLLFDISGSTKNIYKISIYLSSKKIFCNCPDSKKWAKHHNVVCKHICFLLIKVFNLENLDYFYSNLLFTDENIDNIKKKYENICFNNSDYINIEYLEKYKNINNSNLNNKINVKKDQEKLCVICYDDIENIQNINLNKQCNVCKVIIHKICLEKWLKFSKTCPKCRSVIDTNNNNYYKNLNI